MDCRIKREKCPHCHSDKHHNYVVLEKNRRITVFVECAECHILVARYALEHYIDPNAPYESFLKQIRDNRTESARKMMNNIQFYRADLTEEFANIKQEWREHPETRKIYEILDDDTWGY